MVVFTAPGRSLLPSIFLVLLRFTLRLLDILVPLIDILLAIYYRLAICKFDGVISFQNSRRSANFGHHLWGRLFLDLRGIDARFLVQMCALSISRCVRNLGRFGSAVFEL